jgi:hypothetical protein
VTCPGATAGAREFTTLGKLATTDDAVWAETAPATSVPKEFWVIAAEFELACPSDVATIIWN